MTRIFKDRRVVGILVLLAALALAAVAVPYPSIAQIRAWSEAVDGPVLILAFFAVHALTTISPIPRTVFTLSAGVLFGSAVGIAVTLAATTVSAVLAFLLVRAVGRGLVASHLTHPAAKAIDLRLARRGWLAVGSLRLIAAAPFFVVNCCCAVSSVRLVPYTLATIVGILPGTVAVVLLGDVLTGQTNPALMVVTALCIVLGVGGLLLEARLPQPAGSALDAVVDPEPHPLDKP
ncbi:TVP38/TMEM64 family protein [Rhodococcus chondri]|uniref:TVP38/TMEM64 family membrane protein n=1 Tax=Rhodococcus chondri TaxID=3065941 RepID=A0ABU7JTB7_9NOCA|nr:TVP38/TMEM64 family protein [Rhodococcus sp. CC-R104]MEE2033007.1 TVP38/TMEM64 family protein [Rhodococcus sp. CC-R104]